MVQGCLLAADIDFMIHGIVKYSFFGHEVWITTTHVCVVIVMLILIGLAFVANRAMKRLRIGLQIRRQIRRQMCPGRCRILPSWWWRRWTIW